MCVIPVLFTVAFMKIEEAPIKAPIVLQTAVMNNVSIPTFSIKQGVDTVEAEYFAISKKEIRAIKKQARKDYKDSLLRADTLQYVKDSVTYYAKLDTSVIIMPTKCDSAYVQVVENGKELLKIVVDSTYEYVTVEEQLQGIVPDKSIEKIIKKGLRGKKLTSFRNFFNRLYKKVTSGTTVADKILDSPLLGDGMFSPYGNMNCGGSRSIGRKIVNHAIITVGSLGILPTLHYVELGVKEGIGYIFKKFASIGKKDYKIYKNYCNQQKAVNNQYAAN